VIYSISGNRFAFFSQRWMGLPEWWSQGSAGCWG